MAEEGKRRGDCHLFRPQDELQMRDRRQTQAVAELRKWPTHSKEIRSKYSLPAEGRAWTGRPGVTLLGVPGTARVFDVLDTGFSYIRARHPDWTFQQLVTNLWANPSQSVARVPLSYHAPTPATSTVMYSFQHDRTISPAGWMQLFGWPRSMTPYGLLTEAEYAQIAGNGFSVCIAAVVSTAMYCNPWAPWWSTDA